jgi:hypothetical protein
MKKLILVFAVLLCVSLLSVSCNKYSYYYRDKDVKKRDCEKENSKSHKYKK